MFCAPHKIDIGVITAFAGSLGNIPPGWHLCDGTNDTPDLRDKFVPGAGAMFAVGAEAGDTTHVHGFTTPGHTHTIASGFIYGGGATLSDTTDPAPLTGTTDASGNLPQYYALAYIMYKGT